jgi:hypothetical protein
MARIESMAPLGRAQITYMFLGEHTHAQAHKIITDSNVQGSKNIPHSSSFSHTINNNNHINSNNNNITTTTASAGANALGGPFTLSYFYPVLPIEYIIPPPVTTTSMTTANETYGRSTGFSRWKGVGLRRQDIAVLQEQQQQSLSPQSESEYRPLFVLQGNFGGKHAHRRDPKGTPLNR